MCVRLEKDAFYGALNLLLVRIFLWKMPWLVSSARRAAGAKLTWSAFPAIFTVSLFLCFSLAARLFAVGVVRVFRPADRGYV